MPTPSDDYETPQPAAPDAKAPPGLCTRCLRVLAWVFAVGALVSSMLWMFAGWSWPIDLAANLGAQMLLACIVIAAGLAIARRWRPLAVCGLACVLHAIPIMEHRAAIWPRPLGTMRARSPDEVRFLHYNDSSASDKSEVYALIERVGADVSSIVCPPVHMQFDVINGHALEDKYPGKVTRQWTQAADGIHTEVTPAFVVSRWPMTRVDCSFVGPMASRFIAAIVERPSGRFGIVAVHPRSPRGPERWEEGNDVTEALVAVVIRLSGEGIPVVVLTDLNATPTGWRNRFVCSETGLRRAKPLLVADGTYPDVVPWSLQHGLSKTGIPARWPLSIAIDDALVSPEIDVEGWGVGARLRSEHRPVTIELRIPRPATSAANPGDR